MVEPTRDIKPRVIVIPRQLEGFFYEGLTHRLKERDDVRVVVDRRAGQRRHKRWTCGPGPLADRRRGERRDGSVVWTLADMPVSTP